MLNTTKCKIYEQVYQITEFVVVVTALFTRFIPTALHIKGTRIYDIYI